MNLKSNILKISIVIAIIIMLIPAIAAEDSDDSAAVDDSTVESIEVDETSDDDVQSDELTDEAEDDEIIEDQIDEIAAGGDDEGYAAAGELPAYEDIVPPYSPSADIGVLVIPSVQKVKVGEDVIWAVAVYNNGPDTAKNVFARIGLLEGDVAYITSLATMGTYYPFLGIWDVGDLAKDEYAILYIIGNVLSDHQAVLAANVTSDTPDPNPENNFDLGFVEIESDEPASEPSTLPATGNPIAMVLWALISMVGVSFGRKL